jgi:hypothetical protein
VKAQHTANKRHDRRALARDILSYHDTVTVD